MEKSKNVTALEGTRPLQKEHAIRVLKKVLAKDGYCYLSKSEVMAYLELNSNEQLLWQNNKAPFEVWLGIRKYQNLASGQELYGFPVTMLRSAAEKSEFQEKPDDGGTATHTLVIPGKKITATEKRATRATKEIAQAMLKDGMRHPTNHHCYVPFDVAIQYLRSFKITPMDEAGELISTSEELKKHAEKYQLKTLISKPKPVQNDGEEGVATPEAQGEILFGVSAEELAIASGAAKGSIGVSKSGTRIVTVGEAGRIPWDGGGVGRS